MRPYWCEDRVCVGQMSSLHFWQLFFAALLSRRPATSPRHVGPCSPVTSARSNGRSGFWRPRPLMASPSHGPTTSSPTKLDHQTLSLPMACSTSTTSPLLVIARALSLLRFPPTKARLGSSSRRKLGTADDSSFLMPRTFES